MASIPNSSLTPLDAVPSGASFVVIKSDNYFGRVKATAVAGSASTPVTVVTASGASQTLTFPSSGNAAFDITLNANCTIALAGGTSGQFQTITLILRQDSTGGRVPTLPSGVKWPGGVAPTPNSAAGGFDVFTFSTPDARATVLGSY